MDTYDKSTFPGKFSFGVFDEEATSDHLDALYSAFQTILNLDDAEASAEYFGGVLGYEEALDAMYHLASFCRRKAEARRLRLSGNIRKAVHYEGLAEEHYSEMPLGVRW